MSRSSSSCQAHGIGPGSTWQAGTLKSNFLCFSNYFPQRFIMTVASVCTSPLLSVSGHSSCSVWLMTNGASFNTRNVLQHEKPDRSVQNMIVQIHRNRQLHTHTKYKWKKKQNTHDRPQPVPSDWLLLPACCILDRSMCSTYVWIICDPRNQEQKIVLRTTGEQGNIYLSYTIFYTIYLFIVLLFIVSCGVM